MSIYIKYVAFALSIFCFEFELLSGQPCYYLLVRYLPIISQEMLLQIQYLLLLLTHSGLFMMSRTPTVGHMLIMAALVVVFSQLSDISF